jgi:CheY-like chemotaxis protein
VNSHLEVKVEDDGQGIEPEFLPFVFERFRQGDASTTRHHGGLGIGLSIVKSLVELHGGTVRVYSPGKDRGATFVIELPVMVLGAARAGGGGERGRMELRERERFDHPSLAGIRVLAVDDEPDARALVKRILEDCGAEVLVAETAEEALALVRSARPHMIVSDIGMPGEDGYQLIRAVRELSPDEGGRTPAAALSAFARAEDRTRSLRAGYQTHLVKPVEPTELTAVIASLAARP